MNKSFLEGQKQFFLESIFELQKILKEPLFTEKLNQGDQNERFSNEREQAKLLHMRKRSWFYLKKVKKSLRKIEQGNYGICEDCGDLIEEGRLRARPTAELCICCKEEQESVENSRNQSGKVIEFPKSCTVKEGNERIELVH